MRVRRQLDVLAFSNVYHVCKVEDPFENTLRGSLEAFLDGLVSTGIVINADTQRRRLSLGRSANV